MLYSIEAGGKRLRPILLTASFEAYDQDKQKIISTAAALEMIHTYSLIHDDLPAMDDDDFRRGKPTNHRVFDEATAILAGDALLTYSFQIISDDPLLTDRQKIFLIKLLSQASGPNGMVAGQMMDIEAENNAVSLERLEEIHALKTGELIKFAIIAGAFIGGATNKQLEFLDQFAYNLGLIFQVQDDILDVIGDQDKIGKPVGSDEGNNKSTYPKLLGTEGAIEQKQQYVKRAKAALWKAGAADSYLMGLTDLFSSRDR
ncbi:polyprenyl synthetase family protein [Virgibacillus dakarensis]|nr:polyprenyl synthetase family protein [Virgibacillus dakarensis]MTW85109.1 polyprenyl synthetase family protein [Virgibacillus dakarensis]